MLSAAFGVSGAAVTAVPIENVITVMRQTAKMRDIKFFLTFFMFSSFCPSGQLSSLFYFLYLLARVKSISAVPVNIRPVTVNVRVPFPPIAGRVSTG